MQMMKMELTKKFAIVFIILIIALGNFWNLRQKNQI